MTGSVTSTYTDKQCTDSSIKAGVACTSSFVPCTVPCGPDKIGTKLYTCNSRGTVSGKCTFDPFTDYSCYKIVGLCGGAVVIDGTPCDRAECSACGGPGAYATSSDPTPKEGYCICRAPDTSGARKWVCKSAAEWPCPLGTGC